MRKTSGANLRGTMCDQDPRYLQLLAMKDQGAPILTYKFNRIKRPEERFLNFNPEFGIHLAILNDAWTVNLKQTTFKRFNMKGNMFSQKEAQFILDSAETDLANLIKQQDALIQEISRHGERLGKMREARERLESIVGKLKAAMKREEDEDEDED